MESYYGMTIRHGWCANCLDFTVMEMNVDEPVTPPADVPIGDSVDRWEDYRRKVETAARTPCREAYAAAGWAAYNLSNLFAWGSEHAAIPGTIDSRRADLSRRLMHHAVVYQRTEFH